MCTDIAPSNASASISDVSSDRSGASGSNQSRTSSGSNYGRSDRSCSNQSHSNRSRFSSDNAGVFHEDYQRLCQRHKRQPLNFFKLDPRNDKYKLRLCADKIVFMDWELVIGALRHDTTLSFVSVSNRRVGILNFGGFDSVDTREKARKFDRLPVILTRFMMLKFVGAVAQCLSKSGALCELRLEGLPLRADYVGLLCKGLYRNPSLSRLALPHCTLGDGGCEELCKALKHLPNVKVLDLTACGLSSCASVVQLIKFQQLWRTGQCWEQGLRSQELDPESIPGLRRVSLNHNPIGDEGTLQLIDSLADDNFIKAVDLQDCRLTERIVPDLLELVEANNQLLVFDVRHNELGDAALRRIVARFQEGRAPSRQWRWLRADPGGTLVWYPSGKSLRKTASSHLEISLSASTDVTSRAQSALELTQSRVWRQMIVGDTEQCGLHNHMNMQCGLHNNTNMQCGLHSDTKMQCGLHNNTRMQCPSTEQGLSAPAVLQMALGRLLEFATAAESVVGPLERTVECHCGRAPENVSLDEKKGPVDPGARSDADLDSLITLDRINATVHNQTSLTNTRTTGLGIVCPLHPNGLTTDETSLKEPPPIGSLGAVSVADSVTQTISDDGMEGQTSLKSLMRWHAEEGTGLIRGSDESILHAVFLGRKRTNRSVTDSSNSNCTVNSSSNESDSSGSSNSRSTSTSTNLSSSRATFVRLLLKNNNLTSNSQVSSCNRVTTQNESNGTLLTAVS
nr:PREDICTED: uncharacterized protein LOC109043566 [Bemisia tabaci]